MSSTGTKIELSRRNLIAGSSAIVSGGVLSGIMPASKAAAKVQDGAKETLTFPVISSPGTLNPILLSSTAELQVATPIHESLVVIEPETFEPRPRLAESWEVSEDGLTWTFHLREDVLWHDGEPFTADDVKFTMDMMLDPDVNSARGRQFLSITASEVVDEHTVAFQLSAPWASFPVILAGRWAAAPKHILEGVDLATDTSFTEHPIGVGPYKFVESVSGDHVSLEANNDYYGGTPSIPRVNFRILPDTNVQIAQLRTGEIDAIPFFADAAIPSVMGQDGLVIDRTADSIWYAVHLNMNRQDLFGDQRVRQALSYAIDREAMIASLLQGAGQVATGPIIPQISWAYNPDVQTYPYDPERARSLLAEAGWEETDDGWTKDGVLLEFTLSAFTGNATVEQTAVLAQQYFAEIGVRANVEVLEFSTFVTDVRDNRSADGYYSFVSYMTPEPEPDGIYAYFHSSNAERGSNFTAYQNPEVDDLLDEGRSSSDEETRQAAYYRVQEILAEDMTRIFLFYPPANLVRREGLKGLPAMDAYYHLAGAYWE